MLGLSAASNAAPTHGAWCCRAFSHQPVSASAEAAREAKKMARSWRRLCPGAFPPLCPIPEPRGAGELWKRRRSESVALR